MMNFIFRTGNLDVHHPSKFKKRIYLIFAVKQNNNLGISEQRDSMRMLPSFSSEGARMTSFLLADAVLLISYCRGQSA